MTTRHLCYLLFCLLSILPFHDSFRAWLRLALDNQAYSLGLAIPFLTVALFYIRRRAIFNAPRATPSLALPLAVAVILLHALLNRGRSLALSVLALALVWIAGFLLCYGPRALQATRFPLLFLFLMVPIPAPALDALTRLLQASSAEWAYRLFRLVQIPIFRDGFLFSLPNLNIEVAEQCSSIRSSLALLITSLVVGFLFLNSAWRRLALSLAAFPIAVFTNGIRIVILSTLAVYVDQSYLNGYLHHDGGALFSLISVVLLIGVLYFLRPSTLRSTVALALLAASSAGAAQLSLPRPFDVQGSTLTIPVLFLTQADSVSNLQFDLEYDSSSIALSAVAGESVRATAKTLSSSDVAANRKRFLIAGLNQTPLSDGPLLNLYVTVAANAPNGVYPLRFSSVIAADGDARPLVPDNVDGAVTVYQVLGPSSPLQASGVLNAASLLPGPVAPGELIRLIGATPPGATLSFDGTPATLLPVPSNQGNAIVPPALSETATRLQILSQGQPVIQILLPVVPASPAIFTADGGGTGQGAILNEDLTPNSAANPAARGSIITLLTTGLGQSLDTLSVHLGGVNIPILYTETPDATPGVTMVKCKVPTQVNVGYAVPIFLLSGSVSSQIGVTIAIE